MAAKKRPPPQPGTDRYLCPGPVAGTFGVKRHVIADALRQAGRTRPITVAEARRWRDHPEQAPQEGLAVLAAIAAAKAEREHRQQQADLEQAHRMMILREKVEKRLLRGAKHFRSPDAELIACDIAFRPLKNSYAAAAPLAVVGRMVFCFRSNSPLCAGPASILTTTPLGSCTGEIATNEAVPAAARLRGAGAPFRLNPNAEVSGDYVVVTSLSRC